MRTTLTAVSAIALLASVPVAPATAADVYSSGGSKDVAPIVWTPNWTGFYLGVNGGYGQSASSRETTLNGDGSAYYGEPYTWSGSVLGAEPSGFLFGGQVGYLYQSGNFVFGAEFAFDGSSVTGDKSSNTLVTDSDSYIWGPSNVMMHQQLDWVGTLTGIGGFALGNAMLYGKAGLAFGQVQETVAADGTFFSGYNIMGTRTSVDTGWTAGAGIAYKFTPNWSIALEGDFYDLGSHSVKFSDNSYSPALQYTTGKISEDFWAAKAAINYQVNSGYVPLK